MSFMLGNLSIEQIEKRLGVELHDDVRDFMSKNHQSSANNIAKGKWHCFDMPFHLVCGDLSTATKIYESLKYRSSEIKEVLRISVQQ